jgi:hypothetical protein
VVTSYGEKFHRHVLRPTRDVGLLERAMQQIPQDPTGRENLYGALSACLRQFAGPQSPKRSVAIVVVTDETGESPGDERYLEEVIAAAQQAQARIFFLGREAAFGARHARMYWQGRLMLIDRGPETAHLRHLVRDAFGRRVPLLASGFGPYNQCRLARETGGQFVMLTGIESQLLGWNSPQYNPLRLEQLQPDWRPRDEQEQDFHTHPIRQAIVALANQVQAWDFDDSQGAVQWEFPGEPRSLKLTAAQQQKAARGLASFWEQAWSRLVQLGQSSQRDSDPRWQADADLMLAQIACNRLLLQQYQALMAMAERGQMPHVPGGFPSLWYVVPSDNAPVADPQLFAEAKRLLQHVAENWAGTPWAAAAQRQLNTGLGLIWSAYPSIDGLHGP